MQCRSKINFIEFVPMCPFVLFPQVVWMVTLMIDNTRQKMSSKFHTRSRKTAASSHKNQSMYRSFLGNREV